MCCGASPRVPPCNSACPPLPPPPPPLLQPSEAEQAEVKLLINLPAEGGGGRARGEGRLRPPPVARVVTVGQLQRAGVLAATQDLIRALSMWWSRAGPTAASLTTLIAE